MSAAGAQALVVVDVQRGWVGGAHAVVGADDLLVTLAAGCDAARAAGALVVHVQDVGDEDSRVSPGSPGRDLVLRVRDGDVVMDKTTGDAFRGTDLEERLRSAGVTSVAVAGLQSEMCVADTARSALARDFRVVLARDAHTTYDVPADGTGPAVEAAQVSRVAEWALGDQAVLVDRLAEVTFEAPPRGTR